MATLESNLRLNETLATSIIRRQKPVTKEPTNLKRRKYLSGEIRQVGSSSVARNVRPEGLLTALSLDNRGLHWHYMYAIRFVRALFAKPSRSGRPIPLSLSAFV